MLKGKELGAAIGEAIARKGVSKAEVARHFGIQAPSVDGWVKTGRISKDKLPELWAYFSDVADPEHWGLASPAYTYSDVPSVTPSIVSDVYGTYDPHASSSSAHIRIPIHDIQVPDAQGYLLHDDHVLEYTVLKQNWLRQHVGISGSMEQLHILTAVGDSMQPTIHEDDLVLVQSVDEKLGDGVYFISLDNELMIKRLQSVDQGIRILSDHQVYEPITHPLNNSSRHLRILARVVWIWHGRKP